MNGTEIMIETDICVVGAGPVGFVCDIRGRPSENALSFSRRTPADGADHALADQSIKEVAEGVDYDQIFCFTKPGSLNLIMLTMEQYDALDEAEKAAFILQGEFLADREESGLIVQLYSVGSFYGELYYDPLTENNSDSADWIPLLSKIRRYIRRRSTRPWESGSFMWMTRTEILCVLESQFI